MPIHDLEHRRRIPLPRRRRPRQPPRGTQLRDRPRTLGVPGDPRVEGRLLVARELAHQVRRQARPVCMCPEIHMRLDIEPF